jgi:hypothetical protein
VGRFGNFETFRDLTVERGAAGPAATDEFLRRRNYRYSFEGVLKIPRTPLVIGFNANVAAQRYPGDPLPGSGLPDKAHPYSIVRDDLRFLFGARFDFAKLIAVLPQIK